MILQQNLCDAYTVDFTADVLYQVLDSCYQDNFSANLNWCCFIVFALSDVLLEKRLPNYFEASIPNNVQDELPAKFSRRVVQQIFDNYLSVRFTNYNPLSSPQAS